MFRYMCKVNSDIQPHHVRMSHWSFVKFYVWKFYGDLLTRSDLFLFQNFHHVLNVACFWVIPQCLNSDSVEFPRRKHATF